MKVLVIGANGQLGADLCKALEGFEVIGLTHQEVEVCNFKLTKEVLTNLKPDVIINTAAYLKVDECESNEEKAYLVNAIGSRNVAVISEELGAKLIYISTDYVFGEQVKVGLPLKEFDSPAPLNVYGRSKLAGESFVKHLCHKYFIVRTSALFGMRGASGKGGNFVETVIRLASEERELKVVDDQVFSPTYTKDLARKISELLPTGYYGVFHITNRGACSWHDFAKEVVKLAGFKTSVIPVSSREHPQKARRPSYSVLDNYHLRLLGMDDMRPWQEALQDYMKEKGYI